MSCVSTHKYFQPRQLWEIVCVENGHVFAWRNDKDAPSVQKAVCLCCGNDTSILVKRDPTNTVESVEIKDK